jgi:hypothetical protein
MKVSDAKKLKRLAPDDKRIVMDKIYASAA